MIIASVGKDVSKLCFDVHMLLGDKEYKRQFANNMSGLSACLKWLDSFEVDQFNIVFEPTGRYSELLANYFSNRSKYRLFQENPRKISEYRKTIDFRSVDDQRAARVLALYADERATRPERYKLRQFEPKTKAQLALRDVGVRLRGLYKRKNALENHLECGLVDKCIIRDTKAELKSVEKEIAKTLKYAKSIINQDPQLKEDVRRLDTIVGIGELTAIILVSMVDFRKFDCPRMLAIFLGLSNKRKTSGTSVHEKERISKAGNPAVRTALFYPAMSAIEANPQLREFAARLKAKGKIYPVIRTAVTRKLVMLAWTLLAKGIDYDPAHVGGPN